MKWKLCILILHASFSRAFRNLLQTQTTPKDGLKSYFTRINSVTFTTRHYMNSASPQSTALERSDSDILMKEVESVLLPKLFGHPKFRPGQREVITKVLTGESCLAILPTGAGKSLLYMLPSQLLDGITLVISPLLALMRDQVEALRKEGISAVRLDSGMNQDEVRAATSEIISGRVKVLYITPERFNNENFRKLLGTLKVAMFVVDEAHCISEWGHAFRPEYLRLSNFAAASSAQVRLALTATATKRVAQDIVERLNIKVQNIVQLPSSRKNLILSVRSFSYPSDGYGEKLDALLDALPGLANGGSAIIYVNKQNLAERLALDLRDSGYSARAYHSLISNREEVEQWFLKKRAPQALGGSRDREADRAPIVVGTTAFGMGIDKSDVRSVIHFDMPRSVEDYVQGVGRAGRDGEEACCLAFLADSDIPALRSGYKGQTPSYQNLVNLVDLIFCGKAYPAKFDSAMYVNMNTISKEVDIGELQLTLSLAHLVQQEILSFLSPSYGTYKVGRIDEDALTKAIKNLKSNLSGNIAEASADMEDAADDNTQLLEVIIPLVEHIRTHQKRKWCSLDVIELANKLNCKPNVILFCAGILINNQVCLDGGVSNFVRRYAVLKDNVINGKIAEEELENITNILYEHAVELERRGVVRLEELESLLRAGCEDNIDMWELISKYFQEGEDESDFESDAAASELRTGSFNSRSLVFDRIAWAKITALVTDGSLPADDARLIARFATGVGSPRLYQLKLSKHILYGLMVHCDWDDILEEAERLVASIDSKTVTK